MVAGQVLGHTKLDCWAHASSWKLLHLRGPFDVLEVSD